VYADHAASGRALGVVEDFIHDRVLPWYANTHSESSATGRQTTMLREQARRIIHRSVGAGAEHAVVFTGSVSTGAIDKLMRTLGLAQPGGAGLPATKRPVVLSGPGSTTPTSCHGVSRAWCAARSRPGRPAGTTALVPAARGCLTTTPTAR
jgi:Aminotransferase class-V